MFTIAFLAELGIQFMKFSNHRKETFESYVDNIFEKNRNIFDENLQKVFDSTGRMCKFDVN